MAITSSDIILRQPERMTDFPDGGGRMTWNEVVDGQVHNLFGVIDIGDRVFGRVNLRSAFPHVSTPNTDILSQAIGVITARPQDPAVSVLMFSTGSSTDVRADAVAAIETARLMANETPYTLYGNHPSGTTVLSVYGRVGMPEPDRGDVLFLSVEADGYAPRREPVKVQSILYHETEEFEDAQGIYLRDVMQIELTRPVVAQDGAYIGRTPSRAVNTPPPTRIRATRPNDSMRYYGVQPLEESITATPESKVWEIKVPTPYVSLVPSVQSEMPVIDQVAGLGTVNHVQSGAAASLSLSFSASGAAGAAITRYMGMGFAPGSLSITAGAAPLIDDGHGNIVPADFNPSSPWSGTADYSTGRLDIRHATGVGTTAFTVTATPSAPVMRQGMTSEIAITVNNQFTSYVFQVQPVPAAGTLTVDYRINGQWIRIADDGLGNLAGREGDGSGIINLASGMGSLSLPALPDIDSSIILSAGTAVTTYRRDGDTEIRPPYIQHTLSEPVAPGSLEIEYLVGGDPVTLTDDGAGNIITGASVTVGRVVYSRGEIGFRPPTLPDVASSINYSYDSSAVNTQNVVASPAGGTTTVPLTIADPVRPGSVSGSFIATRNANYGGGLTGTITQRVYLFDDGAGNILSSLTRFYGIGAATGVNVFAGTINYATGEIVLTADDEVPQQIPTYGYVDGRWQVTGYTSQNVGFIIPASTTFAMEWQDDSAAEVAETESSALPPIELDLLPLTADVIVPGAVAFDFGGRRYYDRGGTLYYDVDATNNNGTAAGSVDYDSGVATLTDWPAGGSPAVTLRSLLTRLVEPGAASIVFRTPGSPVQQGSLVMSAVTLAGDTITGTTDVNGNITGAYMRGNINADTGVVRVEFGELVTAAGNESEPWYDADLIDGDGKIWRPLLVIPSQIKFGVVMFEYVQVSPTLLGLDPILLPNDGRVRIYRPGDQIVVMDERVVTVTPEAEDVTDLSRENLSQIEIRDADGVPVESVWYTLDLDAGTVTWSDTLDLDAYTLPLSIRHRVDVRRGVLSVQHNGLIKLTAGIDRNFDAATTLVCSALVLAEKYGSPDVQARIGLTFDQAADEINIFRDELHGDPASASYNWAAFPIQLTNRGAITERFKLKFTGPSTVQVIGEYIGNVGTFDIGSDIAPINPMTVTLDNPSGDPYFVIDKDGFGSGWGVNNIIRINTIGADPKVWFARCIQPSDPTDLPQDSYRYQTIGGSA